ncbi:MAG: hypothetical protein JXA09_08455 [Anaerolineae bacterium]|nr:hypothetical protein [Anaerolineae bacterium]
MDHKARNQSRQDKHAKGRSRSLLHRIAQVGERALAGWHPINLICLFGVPLLGLGIWLTFFAAPAMTREMARAQEALLIELADFQHVQPGEEAVLSGILGYRASGRPDGRLVSYVHAMDLVAYEIQHWKCEWDDDEGEYTGSWERADSVAPPIVTLDEHEIPVVLERGVRLHGELIRSPVVWWGTGAWCEGYAEGSIRVIGLRAGDRVCLYGEKAPGGLLRVKELHGGDPASFLCYLERAARSAKRFGAVCLGLGLALAFAWLGIVLSPRLVRERGDQARDPHE